MEGPRDDRRRLDSFDSRGGNSSRQLLRENATEILERISEDFFAVDHKWGFTYLNRRALRRVQLAIGEDTSREELLGRNIWEVFPEQVRSVFYEKYHRAMQDQVTVEFEAHLPLTGKWYGVHAYPSTEGLSVYSRDITERKLVEEKLRRSEERFRTQYEGFPVPTFSWRKIGDDFELADYNLAADQLTQGKMSRLIGLRASEWYSDDPQIMEALLRCHDEGVTIHQERPWHMKTTGEHKHLAVTFARVPPDLVMTHVEDITERKRAEVALEESNTLLRAIIEGTPDPIFLKDTQDRYLLANSAAANVMGRSVGDVLGKTNADLMPPEVANRITVVDRRVMDTAGPQTGEEHVTVQGVPRAYLFTKAPYRNRQGEVAGVIGVARDITGRKQAEEALAQAKERFQSLLRHSSDIITVLATDGTARYQSPAIERVLGYGTEEHIGKRVFDYVHPEDLDRVLTKFARVLNDPGAQESVDFRFRHADGSWRYLEAIGSNLLNGTDIEGVVVSSRDITERREMEEVLRLTGRPSRSLLRADLRLGIRWLHCLLEPGCRNSLRLLERRSGRTSEPPSAPGGPPNTA